MSCLRSPNQYHLVLNLFVNLFREDPRSISNSTGFRFSSQYKSLLPTCENSGKDSENGGQRNINGIAQDPVKETENDNYS